MSRLVLRFYDDPRGYVVDWDSSDVPHGWINANIGRSDDTVLVNADRAYLIERLDA